jgi:hypothetical protein
MRNRDCCFIQKVTPVVKNSRLIREENEKYQIDENSIIEGGKFTGENWGR